jgi:hypothetical protein
VPETEEQITSDSDKEQAKTGNVPEQTGQDAVGVKVARDFGELGIFKGEVERVEEERKRFYYNIIYEDGDREEWNEGQYLYGIELREAIDSGRCVKTNADGTDIASSGEESDYSADREERERIKSLKRKRRQPRLSKTKNVRPALSEDNRAKQVAFAQHVRNRCGLPPGTKILWTMSDEKWFYGNSIPTQFQNVVLTL